MNSSLASKVGKLAVDWTNGLIIRADDQAEVTQAWVDKHPFVTREGSRITAGRGVTAVTYEVYRELGNLLTLQKVVES